VSIKKVKPFIVAEGWTPLRLIDRSDLATLVAPRERQLPLF
jgi:predicted DNA-binding helix-hairpin-helix protein